MNAVEIINLRRNFISKKGPLFRKKKEILNAVDDISFDIKKGEIFSLLGPNGAGKTTTIKILATLLIPSSGQAFVNGYDVVKQDNKVRQVLTAVLPGERTLYWKLTVKENLQYFSSLYAMDHNYSKERINKLLADFDIEDKQDTLVEKLSTGQRQKIVLCRSLLPEPKVLLLDEPTLGLDPVSAKNLRRIVKQISSEGTTVLLTTHYMYEADELSDRVAIIHKGKIACLDTPENLKSTIKAKNIFRFNTDYWDEVLSNKFKKEHAAGDIRFNRTNGSVAVELESLNDSFGIADLSSFCKISGTAVHSINITKPSLEDVFIEKTGSSLSAEEEVSLEPVNAHS